MFEQYRALKAAHPDAILFFRMGDFFEMFFEDAELAAKELELTLTSRNRHDPVPVPMAGVPHHAAAAYIQRLVDNGHRVAIAEQVEDPALAKGLVRREVVRVVTPGIVFDPSTLEAATPNWLAAVARGKAGLGLAFLDVSTGDLRATTVGQIVHAVAELERLDPREVIVGPGVARADLPALRSTWSEVTPEAWTVEGALRELRDTLGEGTPEPDRDDPALPAIGAVLRYARDRLGGPPRNVHALRTWRPEAYLVVDATTRRNLELVRTWLGNDRKGSLLGVLDRAATPMGSRRLHDWMSFPLVDPAEIALRHDAVAAFVAAPAVRGAVRRGLSAVADIERIGARVAQGTAHARDLAALGRSLEALPGLFAEASGLPELAAHLPRDTCSDVWADLERWLVDDPPASVTDGGLIRAGVSDDLDELVRLSLDGVSVLDALEAEEREKTGIASLKIRRHKVFGYTIEVTAANLHRVPERFLRKQTLVNGERFVTGELQDLQDKVLGADERRRELELELFRALRERVAAASARLHTLARGLAELDALAALADVAVRSGWVRPVVDDSFDLDLVAARHPMVEAALVEDRFVPNDLHLDRDRRLVVLTGPNMAGKSTVLRQVALVVLLAQMGSFVPAEAARIGRCDRIFTRVGAADDLRRGQSTFMVEMAETATILHHATSRSLVVLDEIGRGTSTYDGLAIAWAVAEDLHDRIGCRTLFATHYHELCALADSRPAVANLQVAVSERGGEIVFLRRLREGGASRSYGIQCAKLAGLPDAVVRRASSLLVDLEQRPPGEPSRPPEVTDRLREELRALDPDRLSPRDAHAALYTLRALLDED
jgi:DNA mismatch repair protein MutS